MASRHNRLVNHFSTSSSGLYRIDSSNVTYDKNEQILNS